MATPAIEDRSYGIIPLRFLPGLPLSTTPSPKTTQVLLILQKTISPKHAPFWCFPKGHAEPSDRSLKHTACRELFEETSLVVEPSDIIISFPKADEGSFKEVYTNPIRNVGKEVTYWVAVVRDGEREVRVQEKEVKDYRWCSWEEAEGLVTWEDTRGMLRNVREAMGEGQSGD